MKLKILAVAVAAFLVMAGNASAFQWHLSFYKAKAATKAYEREGCEKDRECVAYGASCTRISESRIDCVGGTVNATRYGELECTAVYHWGVDRGGYAKLNIAKPHCYYLE